MIKEKVELWKKLSSKIGCFFSRHLSFPPFFYTGLSLVLASVAVSCAAVHAFVTAIILFFFASFCDVVDGGVARARDNASHLGAYLDGVADRFVDFAILFSYFFFDITPVWLSIGQSIAIASFVVILPSFNVAYANHRKAVHDDEETLIWRFMNRGEMISIMLSILISSLFSPIIAGMLLIILILLSSMTIIQTIIATIYHAKKSS